MKRIVKQQLKAKEAKKEAKPRAAPNSKVNAMCPGDILWFVARLKKKYDPTDKIPGLPKDSRPKQIQYRCRMTPDGDLWLNPEVLSTTLPGERDGYLSLCFNRYGSANCKADSRCLVHPVMYRFWNNFAQIPANGEVSHLTDVYAVGRKNLAFDTPNLNKGRIGCHARAFPGEACNCGNTKHKHPHCRVVPRPWKTREERQAYFAVGDEKATLKALSPSLDVDSAATVLCRTCGCIRGWAAPSDPTKLTAQDLETRIWTHCVCGVSWSERKNQQPSNTPGCGDPGRGASAVVVLSSSDDESSNGGHA